MLWEWVILRSLDKQGEIGQERADCGGAAWKIRECFEPYQRFAAFACLELVATFGDVSSAVTPDIGFPPGHGGKNSVCSVRRSEARNAPVLQAFFKVSARLTNRQTHNLFL
ncbi:hypothetical protein Q7C36_009878 [Tachysurus vachellii]|uniref:Uncharacterized protein n=1 Tax=Tachysurus vachellii TaxID=175792 RepID=A0AA88N4I3_TACVA|nr:hypothetical protein Q7C36_009878 [Tachysurus vachellii]